ncbi:hypothetical protein VNI00_013577 [Paramarasmius palmivorus]|uniref:Uncharacterized protein n=1 Tax=Paramarasmius palmivorus TaxID=297713 RepID=A0AAW0BXF4_9AGAR
MGQRHQAFLIVRLTPASSEGEQSKAYYRCVCAIHHQWCYGRLPLSATRRFLNLLKNPENAEIVRDEIRRAHGKYGRQGTEPAIPALAFPYTQFLFVQAFNMDIDNPYYAYASGVGFERALLNPNVGCCDHDNNDGITIVDITDPLNPAYCHSNYGGGILDAEDYVRRYYRKEGSEDKEHESEVEKDVQCHIASLKNERVIAREALNEVWPRTFSQGEGDENTRTEPSMTQVVEERASAPLPPLADLALKQVVEQCTTDDDFEPLETLADMPGKMESIAEALFSRESLPDSASAVVSRVLRYKLERNGEVVDLSSVDCAFTANAIRTVFASLPSDSVKAVNLSGLHNLTPEVIADTLTAFPKLIRLTLLDTNITDKQILDLLYTQPKLFHLIHDIIHPALLVRRPPASINLSENAPLGDPEELRTLYQQVFSGPYGFTFMLTSGAIASSGLGPAIASVPFFVPEKVLQGLTKCLAVLDVREEDMFFPDQYMQGHLAPSMALSVATPVKSRPVIPSTFAKDSEDRLRWLHRSIGCVPIRGTYDKFLAHGWLFALDYNSPLFSRNKESRYGFIRIDEEVRDALLAEAMEAAEKALGEKEKEQAATDTGDGEKETEKAEVDPAPTAQKRLGALALGSMKVYDIRGFVDAVEKEGRPRPSDEVIAAFEHVIAGSKHPAPAGLPPPKPFRVLDLEEAKLFFQVLIGDLHFLDFQRM